MIELIGTVIGPGGRTIKGITERTNTKIDIEDGGIVTIASHDGAAAEEAQRIIEGLTSKVNEGEVFGLIGPNGAGKSTTLRSMLNFIFPTSGNITINGLDSKAD